MKKTLTLILALSMTLALAACGGSQDAPASSPAQPESSQSAPAADTSAPQADVSQPEAAPEVSQPEVSQPGGPETPEQPAFDPGWAGAEYTMPIPKPPFECEVELDDRGRYTINSVNSDELKALPLSAITDYCETIKALGYSNSLRENVLETGRERQGYEFYGEMGHSCVMLMDDCHGCMIMVILGE